MLTRVKQFYFACKAEIKADDVELIKNSLSIEEQKLFFDMSIQDQYHAIKVFKTIVEISKEYEKIDINVLKKLALLHDVGRKNKDLSTFDKIFAVLLYKFYPKFSYKMAKFGRGNKIDNIRHAMYVYLNHPVIGAGLIKNIGNNSIADIIARHHQDVDVSESIELYILKRADNEN